MMKMLSVDDLKSRMEYFPETGEFFWKRSFGPKAPKGAKVGCLKVDGSGISYWQTKIKGKFYFVHRLAWFYVYGEWPDHIDHINGDSLDNRIANLRSVDNFENQRNRSRFKSNKTGVSGVYHNEQYQTYRVCIGDGKYLGSTPDFFEACCIRKSAEIKLGYHANHGRSCGCAA